MRSRLRFEEESIHRYMGGAPSLFGGKTSTEIQDKTSEWSSDEPPAAWTGDYKAHQVFANAYFDFLNESNWTP